MNGGRAISKAQYVYTEEESAARFSAVLSEVNRTIEALSIILAIKADIRFAVVASLTPYQVVHLGDGTFVVLIDQRAFYMLLTLCFRVQSLPPFSDRFGFVTVECQRSYQGKFLLDIVKDFVFHTEDLSPYLSAARSFLVSQAAITYIVGHEIAHVSHGHLDFKASEDFAQFATSLEDKNLTMRTLEMDADSSATTSVIDIFERHIHWCLSSAELSGEGSPGDICRAAREQYVAGMFMALLCMDAFSANFAPAAYPISYARFLTTSGVTQIALSRPERDAGGIPESVRLLLVSVFERLSGGISTLGHPIAANVAIFEGDTDVPRCEYSPLGIATGQQELAPLHRRWARIRPFLERYQRGGRLAPAQAEPL